MSATVNGEFELEKKRIREEAISATFYLMCNQFMSRGQLLAKVSLDPRRNLDQECGYPTELSGDDFHNLYQRSDIAARVVEIMPKETWQVQPEVYESEDPDTTTPFEESWNSLSSQLRGNVSFFQDKVGAVVWEYLCRIDVISGIGRYGILLLGIDDGLPLSEPAQFVLNPDGTPVAPQIQPKEDVAPDDGGLQPESTVNLVKRANPTRKLLYIRCLPEKLAAIDTWETDKTNPRYGQPKTYSIALVDPNDNIGANSNPNTETQIVHWTRVIHIADNLMTSEVFGMERMRQVFNRILDINKILGSSAEMYYQGAFPGFAFQGREGLAKKDLPKLSDLKDMYEEYRNGLQRAMATAGVDVIALTPQIADPSSHLEVHYGAICIKGGYPIRIFKGSERGELASSQDDDKWNDRLQHRQIFYVTPRVIVPFVDRLILLGVLATPKEYFVAWPDIASQTQQEKADVAVKRTTALTQYVSSGGENVMTPKDFLVMILGFTEKEAKAIIENVQKFLEASDEDSQTSALLSLVGGVTGVIELFKLAATGGISEEQLKQLIMLFYKVDEAKATQIIADGIPTPPEPEPATVPPGNNPNPNPNSRSNTGVRTR